ncbi:MAG TPA: AzlC family ABC transporter permease [Ktedonobacteraceae bacterium]|nr:AzlC family ABC transporter permease [Ktedonobacteraceae bacterium]
MYTTARSEFIAGAKAELPILLGAFPFGMIYGVAALSVGLPASIAQSMSWIVFAGSAQFVVTQLLSASAPALVLMLTVFVINIRHALYSASLAPYLKHLPLHWKWLLAYLLTDEAYAVVIIHYQEHGSLAKKHWYFLGAGLALWLTWQFSTAFGVFLGTQIPASWSLDFTATLTFIALVVPTLRDRIGLLVALTAGLVAVLGSGLPYKLGLVTAACIGIAAGLALETKLLSIQKEKGEQALSGELSETRKEEGR